MTIKDMPYKGIAFSLVSSAENSSLDYAAQYSYIEDIGDGRGYTAGIIGFTSGTSDMIVVVERYSELKPGNILEKYLPALRKVDGTDSHEGLGDEFVRDWITASNDEEMIRAQNEILDEMYLTPAVDAALADGLSLLGQFIYYDAIVVHGGGDTEDCFDGIRAAALKAAKAPSNGGNEGEYLLEFIKARTIVMLKEEAHSDLSRLEAQKKFIAECKFCLELPLEWTMYGDFFKMK